MKILPPIVEIEKDHNSNAKVFKFTDTVDQNGAAVSYQIKNTSGKMFGSINFQNGSVDGCQNEDLILILLDRLKLHYYKNTITMCLEDVMELLQEE